VDVLQCHQLLLRHLLAHLAYLHHVQLLVLATKLWPCQKFAKQLVLT
jgi:hypothetical protein